MSNTLSPTSAVPLYRQLKQLLLEQIDNGKLKGGDRLPTESELCSIYHVGRNTVRTAINELVQEGFLIKKQGKGTFVHMQKIGENITSNLSFSAVCLSNGVVPSNRLVTVALQPASPIDLAALHMAPGSRIMYLARILSADGVPVIYDRLYIHEKYSSLISEPLDNISFYSLLTQKFHITPTRSKKTIELARANEEEAHLLNIKKDDPVLLMNEIVYDENNDPVHRTKQIILGDRFKYEI